MPAYFYHLTLELFPGLQASSSTTSLALESAWEALRPFQKLSSSNTSSKTEEDLQRIQQKNFQALSLGPNASASTSRRTNKNPPNETPSLSTLPSPPSSSSNVTDIRFDAISIECIDMVTPEVPPKRSRARSTAQEEDNLVAAGIGTDILGGLRTKGRYIPLDQKVGESIWGIVHLYRDARESSFLADGDEYPTYLKGSAAAVSRHGLGSDGLDGAAVGPGVGASGKQGNRHGNLRSRSGGQSAETSGYPFPMTASSLAQGPEDDCTTLCILAVPAYLSGSDFLGFVGEKTLDDVCHFRMIRTSRANRYMVLMKFRNGKKASEWQKEWNGKVFNSMEVCYGSLSVGILLFTNCF